MTIVFRPDGTAACLHSEEIPLQELGTLKPRRASSIEFNACRQEWEVRLIKPRRASSIEFNACLQEWEVRLITSGADGPIVFSNPSRDTCLAWEKSFFAASLN
jgi:hypothetical protein